MSLVSPDPQPLDPIYRKVPHDDSGATQLWFITCDEGWREYIVCERMYESVADEVVAALTAYAPSDAALVRALRAVKEAQ